MAPEAPTSISGATLLVVEGRDDMAFFTTLLRDEGLEGFDVRQTEGVTNLGEFLKALAGAEGFAGVQMVAVVRDADTDPAAAARSVRDQLKAAGFVVPLLPNRVEAGSPATAFTLLPDTATPGDFEDLLLRTVDAHPHRDCVDALFDCVDAAGLPTAKDRSAAKVYAFIATSEKPRLRAGTAAGPVFPLEHDALAEIRAFVRMVAKVP